MSTVQDSALLKATAQPATSPPPHRGRAGRRVFGIGALVVIALGGSLVATTLPRLHHERELETAAARAADSPPVVVTVIARRAPATSELTLPGNAQAFRVAALY